MNKVIVIITYIMMVFPCYSQNEQILKIFNDQVAAFNNQNIDKLVDNVSKDFKYFYITSNQLIKEVEGKEDFRKSMEAYFDSGIKVLSEIEDYTIDRNRISFKEVVSHLNIKGKRIYSSALGIYEIRNGKIIRSWYFID